MGSAVYDIPRAASAIVPGLLRLRSDDTLVARFRAGDDAAFEVIVDRYRDRVLGYARHVLRGSDEAEDVVQDVFIRAHRALRRDGRPMMLKPWLYRIAHNRCMDALRRAVPLAGELSEDEPGSLDLAADAQLRADFGELVSDIAELPDQQRSALVIRELEGLSYEELADTLDTTVSAVKSLLVRARVNLAEAAEARALPCASARAELAAPGRLSTTARRHVRGCPGCRSANGVLRPGRARAVAA